MRKVLVIVLAVNALLLAVRAWQELPVAQGGAGGPATDQRFCADSNGDGTVDMSDAITILSYLFTGLGEPPYCIAQGVGLDQFATKEELAALREELLAEVNSVRQLTPTEEEREILGHMSIEQLPTDDEGNTAKTVRFTGVNVQIVNGLGATNGNSENPYVSQGSLTNSLGNLVVGYNEVRCSGYFNNPPEPRSCVETEGPERLGSHNIVVGTGHQYASYGGLVIGFDNTISGAWSSVCGGRNNTASGEGATVSGGGGLNPGNANDAAADWSTISGSGGQVTTLTGSYLP